jgi:cytochrome c oxidase subunit 4
MTNHDLSATSPGAAPVATSTRAYWITMVILMALLVVTVAAAEVDLGPWNLPLAFSIASAKAALILYIFMHIRGSTPLIWLFAFSGFFWLAVLMALTLSDYLTR